MKPPPPNAWLRSDIARCDGISGPKNKQWRDNCEHCLRRIAARNHPFYMVQAPEIRDKKCEFLILQKK
jgi:hypothetical protein